MKNTAFCKKQNSTLSCILKCLRFEHIMIHKKIIFGLFITSLLGACTSPTAMLGPVYTFTSTGNVYQTALTYGSNKAIEKETGKSPLENLKEISKKNKNIHKETLESEEFYILVENKIKKNFELLNSSNQ